MSAEAANHHDDRSLLCHAPRSPDAAVLWHAGAVGEDGGQAQAFGVGRRVVGHTLKARQHGVE